MGADSGSSTRKIIGISLLRNEEYFAPWSLAQAVDFCDELIVVDNDSTDRTLAEVEAFAEEHPGVVVHQVRDANTTHQLVQDYAGEDVWVFGVDGDEIYDPAGLVRLRRRILAGEFQDYWTLSGYMFHVLRVELDAGRADGFITPHTPRGNKLFNFSALVSWEQPDRERLHGHAEVFRDGYSRKDNLDLFDHASWDDCDLRALHLCFFPRSSRDGADPTGRKNPFEVRAKGLRRIHNAVKNRLAAPFAKNPRYKTRKYRRGPVVSRDISAFGRPSGAGADTSDALAAERVLSEPRE